MSVGKVHSARARTALAQLTEVDPALAALALWCVHRDHASDTFTDGETIHYGPTFTSLTPPEQIGLAAHHILHVALRHSARQAEMAARLGRSFKPRLYNLASDAIVNEVLISAGHAVPRPAVRAKELIDLLPGFENVAPNVLADWDTDRLYLALAKPLDGDPSKINPDIQDYMMKRKFAPDLESKGDFETSHDQWSARMDQALDAGRSAGSGIGQILHRFADFPTSRTPWEVHLRRLVAKATSETPRLSDKRPANRWLAQDADARISGRPAPAFVAGYTRDRRRPRVVVAVDTSSSVTDLQIELFASEIMGIARRSAADIHLLAFDTEVHLQTRFDGLSSLNLLEFRRGGGTDFAPVLQTASKSDPSILVVMTDLDAPIRDPLTCPVIWAVPEQPKQTPPFGKVLVMDH